MKSKNQNFERCRTTDSRWFEIFLIIAAINRFRKTIRQLLVYPKIFAAMTAVILAAGYLIYFFERGKSPYFHSWWDGIWFAIITSSTVGYGDKYPVTVPGQVVTIILILIGGSLLAVLLANIGGTLALRISRKERGLLPAKQFRNHIVLCHWNKQAKTAIIDYYKAQRRVKFVLIDGYIEENPVSDYDVHFIRGNFSEDDILIKANVMHAKTVLIFGDKRIDENTADAKAMKAILAVKHLNPKAHVIVESLSGDVRSLQRVGADEVIDTGQLNGRLLIKSSLSVGISDVLQELLLNETGNEFYESAVPRKYIGWTFGDVATDLRQSGVNLIALRQSETVLNPTPNTVVEENSILIYIAHERIKAL